MTTNMVSPTRPLRHVNVVTVEKRSPRARTISIDETLILKNAICENPPASASRKRGAATHGSHVVGLAQAPCSARRIRGVL